VATHPEDDLILATALSGAADYLITGDSKLQKLGTFQSVTILSPRVPGPIAGALNPRRGAGNVAHIRDLARYVHLKNYASATGEWVTFDKGRHRPASATPGAPG
jgi:hypothetical protein